MSHIYVGAICNIYVVLVRDCIMSIKTITTINLDKKVNTAVVEFLVNLSAETDQQLKAIL